MKKQINPSTKAHLLRSAFIPLLLLAVCVIPFALARQTGKKPLAPRTYVDDVLLTVPYESPTSPVCSPDWQIIPSPNQSTKGNDLKSVAVVSSTDVWAVGYYTPESLFITQTLAEHWDGTQWSAVPSPNQGTDSNSLSSVAVVSSTDVWAVGFYFGASAYQTLAEHWDGTHWSIVPIPNQATGDNQLNSVAVVSPTDVWAVGYYNSEPRGPFQALVEHWDGTQWSIVPAPHPGNTYDWLLSVAVVSSTDVWAVGNYDNDSGAEQALVEHWDGTSWSVVPSPNQGTIGNTLYSVGVVSSTDVWAVGFYYNDSVVEQTLVEHWDGESWSIVPSPNQGTHGNFLRSVRVVSSTHVWAVGVYLDDSETAHTLVEHWDGTSWSIVPSPNQGTHGNWFNSVGVVSSTDVWAVGSYEQGVTFNDFQTLVERYNPCPPTPTPTPTPTPGQITLSARGYKVQGQQTVDLTWIGGTSSNVDVYRNGVLIATEPNIPGFYTDHIGVRGRGTYTYKACDAGTQNCSNQVTVRFGGGGGGG
jgi:hypothetical protein